MSHKILPDSASKQKKKKRIKKVEFGAGPTLTSLTPQQLHNQQLRLGRSFPVKKKLSPSPLDNQSTQHTQPRQGYLPPRIKKHAATSQQLNMVPTLPVVISRRLQPTTQDRTLGPKTYIIPRQKPFAKPERQSSSQEDKDNAVSLISILSQPETDHDVSQLYIYKSAQMMLRTVTVTDANCTDRNEIHKQFVQVIETILSNQEGGKGRRARKLRTIGGTKVDKAIEFINQYLSKVFTLLVFIYIFRHLLPQVQLGIIFPVVHTLEDIAKIGISDILAINVNTTTVNEPVMLVGLIEDGVQVSSKAVILDSNSEWLIPPQSKKLMQRKLHQANSTNQTVLIDMRNFFPFVYDQGSIGSCVANTIAAQVERHTHDRPSRLAIHYVTKSQKNLEYYEKHKDDNPLVIPEICDASIGVLSFSAYIVLARYGVIKESAYPYDIKKVSQQPPIDLYKQDDVVYGINPRQRIIENTTERVQEIQNWVDNHLKNRNPVAAAIYIKYAAIFLFDVITATPEILTRTEEPFVGHMVLIVGIDKENYILRNSWGINANDKGYFYLPKKHFNLLMEVWALEGFEKPDKSRVYVMTKAEIDAFNVTNTVQLDNGETYKGMSYNTTLILAPLPRRPSPLPPSPPRPRAFSVPPPLPPLPTFDPDPNLKKVYEMLPNGLPTPYCQPSPPPPDLPIEDPQQHEPSPSPNPLHQPSPSPNPPHQPSPSPNPPDTISDDMKIVLGISITFVALSSCSIALFLHKSHAQEQHLTNTDVLAAARVRLADLEQNDRMSFRRNLLLYIQRIQRGNSVLPVT